MTLRVFLLCTIAISAACGPSCPPTEEGYASCTLTCCDSRCYTGGGGPVPSELPCSSAGLVCAYLDAEWGRYWVCDPTGHWACDGPSDRSCESPEQDLSTPYEPGDLRLPDLAAID